MIPPTIDELIEKLRNHSEFLFIDDAQNMLDAASALTSLQERNRKLEEALRDVEPYLGAMPSRIAVRYFALLSGGGEG